MAHIGNFFRYRPGGFLIDLNANVVVLPDLAHGGKRTPDEMPRVEHTDCLAAFRDDLRRVSQGIRGHKDRLRLGRVLAKKNLGLLELLKCDEGGDDQK